MNKRVLGDAEEVIAIDYIKANGYTIIERNFRCKIGEIDIVAMDGNVLVFLEVKYRSSLKYGYPSQAVTAKKQNTIYKVAQFFLIKNNYSFDTPIRFDVVSIIGNDVELIKNAFGGM